jgi:mannose-6-phosphate isomerase-like protein (cupin superfamily)
MKQHIRTVAIAVLSFAIGAAITHLPQAARAAAAPLVAGTYDLAVLTTDTLPPPTTTFPNLRSKTMVIDDGMTLAVQMGTAFKHQHYAADEVQIVLEGTGTAWLGDSQVALKPGTMLVIPKGTTHAGFVETSGHLKWISLKSPPQDPSDVHPVP